MARKEYYKPVEFRKRIPDSDLAPLIEKAIAIGLEKQDASPLSDALQMCMALEVEYGVLVEGVQKCNEKNYNLAHKLSAEVRKASQKLGQEGLKDAVTVYKRSLLFDARGDFDCFCRYIEWNREPKRKFYEPRRKQLLPIARSLQDLHDDNIDILGISLPPGVGKTTLAEFYLAWYVGKHPELPILTGSHNNAFLAGVYGEMLRLLDPQGEYLWKDVFPNLGIVSTNAKDMMIDVAETKKRSKRYASLEFTSVGAGNAGKVRAMGLLYCDDLVDGIETAMSRDRLDKLWQQYHTDLRQRKQGNKCKELHIATRWSVNDILGRLENEYDGNPRARFLRFPALNENEESNFDYPYGVGFSTEMYREQRKIMDDASWRALYMNEPIEREGQLYAPDELQRYYELPEQEPDAILGVVDSKDQGLDYCVMPVAYKYGDMYYIEDFVCNNSKPEIVEELLAQKMIMHGIKQVRFESNRAGGQTATRVQARVRELGGHTKITTKWNEANKEARIQVASPWVKTHCLFREDSTIEQNHEYRTAMRFLCSYTMAGKNKHDDVPDALADLENFTETFDGNIIRAISRHIW